MIREIVVMGASVGGLAAMQVILPALPEDLPVPLVIVQHRVRSGDSGLCKYLQQWSRLPIVEPEDKEEIRPGRVYLAPRDYHLLIERGAFALSTEAPVTYARPSIDALFESAADVYQESVIGVVLTGTGHDGARGLAKIKALGGLAVVEDPATAEARAMPEAAIAATRVDRVLSLTEIAPFLVGLYRPLVR